MSTKQPPLLDVLRSSEEVLEGRDVALRGVTNVNSSFIPIELRQRNTTEVSVPFLVIVRDSYLPISAS